MAIPLSSKQLQLFNKFCYSSLEYLLMKLMAGIQTFTKRNIFCILTSKWHKQAPQAHWGEFKGFRKKSKLACGKRLEYWPDISGWGPSLYPSKTGGCPGFSTCNYQITLFSSQCLFFQKHLSQKTDLSPQSNISLVKKLYLYLNYICTYTISFTNKCKVLNYCLKHALRVVQSFYEVNDY